VLVMVAVVGLLEGWVAALPGVPGKLVEGATIADVGCGGGETTIALARSYPESRFWGFDSEPAAIRAAGERAAGSGVADRIRFEVAGPQDYPGTSFDLVCHFDRMRSVADPAGAARHVLETLAPDGSWLLVADVPGEFWLRQIAKAAGFSRFRRVARTPFDVVLEGKP
jgi:2-polyprenyl-3-methyl-5-hydroxy-6-metoxy-1,4-benzoquinol methylase